MVLHYTKDLCSVVIPFSTIISFDNVPPENNQGDTVPNTEPLSQPILEAMFRVIVMLMEKHTHDREKEKRKLDLLHLILHPLPLPTYHVSLRHAKIIINWKRT